MKLAQNYLGSKKVKAEYEKRNERFYDVEGGVILPR